MNKIVLRVILGIAMLSIAITECVGDLEYTIVVNCSQCDVEVTINN